MVNSSCLVTVIVVNYNQGRYLARAIESILNQTFDNYSILLVDDGSTDDSLHIADQMAGLYPSRIEVVYHADHQNMGLLRTYQLAFSMGKGEYFAFLEADDWWDKDYLKNKVEILDQNKQVGVVFSRYKVVSEGWYGKDMVLRQAMLRLFTHRSRPFNNMQSLLKRNNIATFSSFVTRKDLLNSIAIPDYSDVVFFDWWVLLQLSMQNLTCLDQETSVYWQIHRDSTLGRQTLDLHKKRLIRFMDFVYESIEQNVELLDDDCRKYFFHMKQKLPFFTEFYANPDILNFLKFFGRDPLWAFETLLSYCINKQKYGT